MLFFGTLALTGCASSPFVDLGPLSDDDVERVLRERTTSAAPLHAELVIEYSDPENSGTFDAVAVFDPDGSMEVHAFKDLIITVEHVFDLVFTPETYDMELRAEDGEEPIVESGATADFAGRHPEFGGFFWGREAFCLPGSLGATIALRRLESQPIVIETALRSGAQVTWTMDPATLEVTHGHVSAPEFAGNFLYEDYRRVGELFVPGVVTFADEAREIRIRVHVEDVEALANRDF